MLYLCIYLRIIIIKVLIFNPVSKCNINFASGIQFYYFDNTFATIMQGYTTYMQPSHVLQSILQCQYKLVIELKQKLLSYTDI